MLAFGCVIIRCKPLRGLVFVVAVFQRKCPADNCATAQCQRDISPDCPSLVSNKKVDKRVFFWHSCCSIQPKLLPNPNRYETHFSHKDTEVDQPVQPLHHQIHRVDHLGQTKWGFLSNIDHRITTTTTSTTTTTQTTTPLTTSRFLFTKSARAWRSRCCALK